MRFFIDENLSQSIAMGMAAFGEDVTHLKDNFPVGTKDIEWLTTIGKRGWILITRDERIRWNPAERRTIKASAVGAFFLGGKELNGCQLIQQLVRNWPRIKELAKKTRPPFVFRIPRSGTKFVKMPLS